MRDRRREVAAADDVLRLAQGLIAKRLLNEPVFGSWAMRSCAAADELWAKSKDLALPELQSMRDSIKAMDAASRIEKTIVSSAAKKGFPQLPAGNFIRPIENWWVDLSDVLSGSRGNG